VLQDLNPALSEWRHEHREAWESCILERDSEEADMAGTQMNSGGDGPDDGRASGVCRQSGAEPASVSGIRTESLSPEDVLPPSMAAGNQVLREGWEAFVSIHAPLVRSDAGYG